MTAPVVVDLPHSLGREEARRRLKSRVGELPGHIPGGFAQVDASWPTEDEMALRVAALGQTVDARLTVMDAAVRVQLVLPPMLSFVAPMIEAAVRREGGRLLLPDGTKR